MPIWDVETGTLYIGDGSTAGGVKASPSQGVVPQYKSLTASAAATETLYWRPNTSGNTYMLGIAAGAGGYTKPIVLSRETREDGAPSGAAVADGTRITICATTSTLLAGRIVEIRDNSDVGNLLDTFTSDTEQLFTIMAEYVYDATSTLWKKLGSYRMAN